MEDIGDVGDINNVGDMNDDGDIDDSVRPELVSGIFGLFSSKCSTFFDHFRRSAIYFDIFDDDDDFLAFSCGLGILSLLFAIVLSRYLIAKINQDCSSSNDYRCR